MEDVFRVDKIDAPHMRPLSPHFSSSPTPTSYSYSSLTFKHSFAMSSPKTILLTGASRGIGLAIAKYLLNASHNVFLVARSVGPMEELKKQYPGQVEFLAADLKDFEVCDMFLVVFALSFELSGSCSSQCRLFTKLSHVIHLSSSKQN